MAIASISSLASVSINTSNQDHGQKMIRKTPDCAICNVLNGEFVAGLSTSSPTAVTFSLVCACLVRRCCGIFEN